MFVFRSENVKQTEQFAQRMASVLRAGDILAFEGDLGAGKTAFVRGIAKGVHAAYEVSSPTFSLVQEYGGQPSLVHFDMYRIDSIDDLYTTGFFDYLDGDFLLAIEWSERITPYLPDHTIYISIKRIGENIREIHVKGDERFAAFSD